MTTDEIKLEVDKPAYRVANEHDASQIQALQLTALWEIAYQLAKINEIRTPK